MANESWTVYGSKLTGELVTRLYLNSLCPGLGCLIDFAKAARDYCRGNSAGAEVNVLCGFLEIGTAGISSFWKGFAQGSGKEALIQAAKEKAKTDGKKLVGKQVARALAKGGVKQTVNEVFSAYTKLTFKNMGKSAGFAYISSGGYEVGKTVFEGTFQYLGESAWEHILKGGVKQNAQIFQREWMKEAVKRGVAPEYIKHYATKFSWELWGSCWKGKIKRSFNASSPTS